MFDLGQAIITLAAFNVGMFTLIAYQKTRTRTMSNALFAPAVSQKERELTSV